MKEVNWSYFRFIILVLAVTLLFSGLSEVSAQDYPKIEPYVNDFAHLMPQSQIDSLNLQADSIEKNTTYEIAIVTIPTTNGQDIIEFANRIGDENGVGKKDLSNGLVVIWDTEGKGQGAIATGRGSENIFNDALVGRIGRESRPYFDNQSYYEGFSYILNQLNERIVNKNQSINSKDSSNSDNSDDFPWIVLLPLGVVIFFAVAGIIISDGGDTNGNAEGEDGGNAGNVNLINSNATSISAVGGFSGAS